MTDPVPPQPIAPAPTPHESFAAYLKTFPAQHAKLLGVVVGVILLIIGFNYVRDLRAKLENQEKITSTLSQQFQQVGTNAITGNAQATKAQVTQQASDTFGPAVLAAMQAQNAQINSLTTAVGLTQGSVTALQRQAQQQFTPQQQNVAAGGALTGYPMQESRTDGPPLTSVSLSYDPTKRDPNQAFAGTRWTHYQEQFQASFGEWVKQKDGGFRNTVSLTRTVSRPDPIDPTKLVQVGTETIPITGASTVYTPQGLLQGSDLALPRWTLGLGVAKSTQNGYTPAGQVDYRFTNKYGLFVGAGNNAFTSGVSIRLGVKK